MIFKHLSSKTILENYTAWGLLLFCIPIYIAIKVDEEGGIIIGTNEGGFPVMHELNFVPKALFFAAAAILGAWMFAGMSVNYYGRVPIIALGSIVGEEEI